MTMCLMVLVQRYRLVAKNRAAALGLSQSFPRPDAASDVSAFPYRFGSPRVAVRKQS
jgi:hypothetical protein